MAEITRHSGRSDWIELECVERERTPRELMKLSIRLHLSGLSVSDTNQKLDSFGVKRSRNAVHDWVQKTDLHPADDASPDHLALDETVIRINGQQFWLYAAVDPDTNIFLHVQLFTTHYDRINTALSVGASGETRRLRRRVSHQLRSASNDSTPSSRAPISDGSP